MSQENVAHYNTSDYCESIVWKVCILCL